MKNWLIHHKVDITGWQETGIAFHTLNLQNRLPEWAKQIISYVNNKSEKAKRFQYEGTAIMAFDEATHRVKKTGGDTTGFGQWSWMKFFGRQHHCTCVVFAFMP